MFNLTRVVESLRSYITRIFVGNEDAIKVLLATMMAGGHALIMGPVGSGKTTLAKALANAIGGSFKRVQITVETLPSDILGFVVYTRDGASRVIEGPIFANVVLLDELNRAPPRTLSALLEAMQEGQVTLDGNPLKLPRPHMVIATINVKEIELGITSQLPLAVLDRFMSSIYVDYVSGDYERSILLNSEAIEDALGKPSPIVDAFTILKLHDFVRRVYVSDAVADYVLSIVNVVRRDGRVIAPLSTRAAVSLLKLAKAFAILDGRDYVIPDDVKAAALPALAHRILVRQEYSGSLRPVDLVQEALRNVPAPVYYTVERHG